MMKKSDLITIDEPDDERQLPKDALDSWATGGFVVRECALDVWNEVRTAVASKRIPGVYVPGRTNGRGEKLHYVLRGAQGS